MKITSRVFLVLIAASLCVPRNLVQSEAQKSSQKTARTSQAYTPEWGSAERKAILDALRKEMKQLHEFDLIFVVRHFKVHDRWAWLDTDPQSPDGSQHYESVSALMHHSDDSWEVAELACTEEEDPECLGAPNYFELLRSRFPDIPTDIFPDN